MGLFNKSNKKNSETYRLPMGNKSKRAFAMYMVLMLTLGCLTTTTLTTSDSLMVVNSLPKFIFGLIRVIGIILLDFGVVQVGSSLKSHNPNQRANGFLTLVGGAIITFAKRVLTLIIG